MRKTFLKLCYLALSTALVLSQILTDLDSIDDGDYIEFNYTKEGDEGAYKNYPPLVTISDFLLTGNYTEAVNKIIVLPETQTTDDVLFNEVIRLLNQKLNDEEKVLSKIFDLIKHTLFYMEKNNDLDQALQIIFTSMFKYLLAQNKLYSYTMVQLSEYARLATRVYTKGFSYLSLFVNLSNNTFPSSIKTLVWTKGYKCIKNKMYDQYLFQPPSQLAIGDFSRANIRNDQRWKITYDYGSGIYHVYNFGCECYIGEINHHTIDGDVIVGSIPIVKSEDVTWKFEPINDFDFYMTSSGRRLFAHHELHVFNGVRYREVFMNHKTSVSDVWSFVDCLIN